MQKSSELEEEIFEVYCTKCEEKVEVRENEESNVSTEKFTCINGHFGPGIYTCQHCSGKFFHSNPRKFCIKCVTKRCFQCHKYFVGSNLKSLYCSPECKKESIKKVCVVCNKEYYSQSKKKRTCSTECQWLLKGNVRTHSCKWCKKLFEIIDPQDHNTYFFCSSECRKAHETEPNRYQYKSTKNQQTPELREKTKQDINSIKALVQILIEPRLEVEREFGFYYDVNQDHFSENLKELVRKRDGYRCVVCDFDQSLAVHHKIPRRLGGVNHEDNLVTLCSGCHMSIETGDIEHATKKCFERYCKNHGKINLSEYVKVNRDYLKTEITHHLDELFVNVINQTNPKELVKKIELTLELVRKINLVK